MIIRSAKVEINLSPLEMAEEFVNWGSDEQAEFFSWIAKITRSWKKPFCFQLQFISDSSRLTPGGRSIMQQIGEYSGYDS